MINSLYLLVFLVGCLVGTVLLLVVLVCLSLGGGDAE